MGPRLQPRQLELYRAIEEILSRDWDPLGISSPDGPRDEYQMYVPEVYRLALAGERSEIVDYLFWVATDRMGLTTHHKQHLAAADKILAARERIGIPDGDA